MKQRQHEKAESIAAHHNSMIISCSVLCRFGAEDLFKAAEEGSAERSKQLLEEDIDAILERAELVEDNPGSTAGPEGAADLLSSFNVATFKVWSDWDWLWDCLSITDEATSNKCIDSVLGLPTMVAKILAHQAYACK